MKNILKSISALFVTISLSSCMKDYQEEKYIEVSPNETAYVIPLETGNKDNQTKLKSVEYLEQNKVVAKRIYTPTQFHSTGRMWWSGNWIASVRVIKVDRTPVTREWTAVGTGTDSTKKEDVEVESSESIGFGVGITCTASIPEEWATIFLYNYNGRTLSQVMDNDVRGYVQNILTTEFGSMPLSKFQSNRKEIFNLMRDSSVSHFSKLGVRVMNLGAAGQFSYIDENIQDAINDKFSSEMKITSANNEVIAAEKFAKARSSIEAQKNLDADINIKNAIAEGIRSGKIPVPTTIAGNNISIMDLYGLKSFSTKNSK